MREKIQKEIEKRIELMKPGYVFSAKDFVDISTQDASNQALSRLDKEGKIRRIIRGFYYVRKKTQRKDTPPLEQEPEGRSERT